MVGYLVGRRCVAICGIAKVFNHIGEHQYISSVHMQTGTHYTQTHALLELPLKSYEKPVYDRCAKPNSIAIGQRRMDEKRKSGNSCI